MGEECQNEGCENCKRYRKGIAAGLVLIICALYLMTVGTPFLGSKGGDENRAQSNEREEPQIFEGSDQSQSDSMDRYLDMINSGE